MNRTLAATLLLANLVQLPLAHANHGRNLDPVKDAISQVEMYRQPLPNATPSEAGHQNRMKNHYEIRSVEVLRDLTFEPNADVEVLVREAQEIESLSRSLSGASRREMESILVQTAAKDAKAEASQKSSRQAQFQLEELADKEARLWGSGLERSLLAAAVDGTGQVLESRLVNSLCSISSQYLESDRMAYRRLEGDPLIAARARAVYGRLASIIEQELARRNPPPPPGTTPPPGSQPPAPLPVACLNPAVVRDVNTRELVDPALGLFLRGAARVEVEADSFAGGFVDELVATVDSSASYYLRTRSTGRGRLRFEVVREPTQEMVVLVRLTALDMSRRPVAESVVPVTLAGLTRLQPEPQAPVARSTQLLVDLGTGSRVVSSGATLDMVKGQRAILRGSILDQYNLVMGEGPAEARIVSGAFRIELQQNQFGSTVLVATNVVDWTERTQIQYTVLGVTGGIGLVPTPGPGGPNGPGHGGPGHGPGHGGPGSGPIGGLAQTGVLNVKVGFAPFRGFSPQEARDIVERLYKGILQRNADWPGADGYVRNLMKNGLKGLRDSAADIGKSVEFRTNILSRQSPEQVVEAMYQGILGRPSDPGGLAANANEVRKGKAHDVAATLSSSTEFRNHVIGR